MSRLRDWLDHRTGYRRFGRSLLYEPIPGGARWRYVWGSTLLFTFLLQLLTGFCLWTAYSPSVQTAWESVYFIQHQMQLGWFVRGLHHYASDAMIVLLILHLLQVVIAGAYRRPREVNWWLGLVLMGLVLGLALTGYLLPWDERGYWATQVTTKILSITPLLGPTLEQLVVGGPVYGHHTLTRFFALHAGLLPALLVLLIAGHVALFRRHGVTHPKNVQGKTRFWPDQALRDGLACLVVLLALVGLTLWAGPEKGFVFGSEAGALLQAPAEASQPSPSARPEWYFLSLYQFLKYFPGETEVYGAIVIPSLIVGVFILLPFLGRRRWGHAVCVFTTFGVLTVATLLTVVAIRDDQSNPIYRKGLIDAERRAERVVELAQRQGIPSDGAVQLLRLDPQTQGPILFRNNCAACHRWKGLDGTGLAVMEVREGETVPMTQRASDLAGFGGSEWISGLLRDPSAERFFGHTEHKDSLMAKWSRTNIPLLSNDDLEAVVTFLIGHGRAKQMPPADPERMAQGAHIFAQGSSQGSQACITCHRLEHPDVRAKGLALGPDLTGYASQDWLREFIMDPSQSRFYSGDAQSMPKFGERLTVQEIELLVDWILGVDVTNGGRPALVSQ